MSKKGIIGLCLLVAIVSSPPLRATQSFSVVTQCEGCVEQSTLEVTAWSADRPSRVVLSLPGAAPQTLEIGSDLWRSISSEELYTDAEGWQHFRVVRMSPTGDRELDYRQRGTVDGGEFEWSVVDEPVRRAKGIWRGGETQFMCVPCVLLACVLAEQASYKSCKSTAISTCKTEDNIRRLEHSSNCGLNAKCADECFAAATSR